MDLTRYARLARPAIRRLKPGEKITERGIAAECLQNGDIRYSVNIMVDGQRIHRVIGKASDGTTRTQAEEFIAKVRSDAKAGRLDLPKGRKVRLTFAAAAALYVQRLREGEGKRLIEKDQHFRLHLLPELGRMPLDKISTFTLEKYRKAIKAKGLSPSTVDQHLATYRHMSNKLVEWKKIDEPLPMIPMAKEDNRRDNVLSEVEIAALLDAALRDSNPRIHLFIMMGLHTGLRHSEILAARFDRLDVARRRLTVPVKGGDLRDQPLTQSISEILESERDMAQDPEGWVFPNPRSASGHVESMKSPFRRVVIRAKLDPKLVIPHVLRHTAITEMSETGAEPRTIQAFSGHKTKEMVWRYTHARDKRLDEAMDRFDKAKQR